MKKNTRFKYKFRTLNIEIYSRFISSDNAEHKEKFVISSGICTRIYTN